MPINIVAAEAASGQLKFTPLANEELQRRTGIAVSMMRRNSLAVRAVANELNALTRTLIQEGHWAGATWIGED